MSVNKPPQVTSTTPQDLPPSTDPPEVTNQSASRKRENPYLRADNLISGMIIKGVVGLIHAYSDFKKSNQELPNGKDPIEQLYKSRSFNIALKLLEIGLPSDYRPFFSAAKNTAANYFGFKGFMRGGTINPESVKYGSFATAIAGIAHACTFYPGSKGKQIADRLQTMVTHTRGLLAHPKIAPVQINVSDFIKMLMVVVATEISKTYTKDSSYSRVQLPQDEESTKLLREKDEVNSFDFLTNHALISAAGAIILLPLVKEEIGSALLRLVRNPTELFKSFTMASVPALITVGSGMLISNEMQKASGRADYDTLVTTPKKFPPNKNGEKL